jgi:hypothetical protein
MFWYFVLKQCSSQPETVITNIAIFELIVEPCRGKLLPLHIQKNR